jgi:hypothetical protein
MVLEVLFYFSVYIQFNQNDFTDTSGFLKERINCTTKQNNVSPIESVKVGSGLGLGYTSDGSGGFQQSNTIDYAMPKSIDELRTKINQKNSTYEIPFQGPSKGIDKRAEVAPLSKNKPERKLLFKLRNSRRVYFN